MDDGRVGVTYSNRFLKALDYETIERLQPDLEPVEFVRRQQLYAVGGEPAFVYFLNRGLVSLVKTMSDGRIVEIGAVGPEGAVYLGSLLGLPEAVVESVVQLPGDGVRIKTATFRERVAEIAALRDLLGRYVSAAFGQLAQTSACNRLHSLEQRCCRWLLVAHDSAGGNDFHITHEYLALMLGVQRPGVSIAARGLQDMGLINYRNGRVWVTDRTGLEAHACECYHVVRAQLAEAYRPH